MAHPSQAHFLVLPAAGLLQARSAFAQKRHSALVSKLPLSPGCQITRSHRRASHYPLAAEHKTPHCECGSSRRSMLHEMPSSDGCRQRVHLVAPTNLCQANRQCHRQCKQDRGI